MRVRGQLPAARLLYVSAVMVVLLLLLLGSASWAHTGRKNQASGGTAEGAQAATIELLRVRVANLYAATDTSRENPVLLSSTFYSLGQALSELGEQVATSTSGRAGATVAFESLSLYNDALHYFEQAERIHSDEGHGADGAQAENLKAKATALRKTLLQRHRSAFQQRAQDDGFHVGDTLYAFTKRQAGAKSATSQKVKLLKTKGGVAGKVFVQLQSGRRRSKQKVPYTWLRRQQRFSMPIPRMTTAELLNSPHLLRGHEPFIITDALATWPAMQR